MNNKRKFFMMILSLLLISLACDVFIAPQATPEEERPEVTPESSPLPPMTPPPGVYAEAFADYPIIDVRLPERFSGGYTLPLDISVVDGMEELELSAAQIALLQQNGFVVADPEESTFREFYQIYERNRYQELPNFITTDSVFHIYHLIFDKMLRDLEREFFIPTLEQLTTSLLDTSIAQYTTLIDTPLEEAALRNVAYFGVAARLLELEISLPDQAETLAQAEFDLIHAHQGAGISPIWDTPDLPEDEKLIEDYSQYIPRGHYTLDEALERYFRAMMWYGRMTFRLKNELETKRALLMVQILRTSSASDGTPAITMWQNIYDPTVFIVGKSDDLSFYEYGALSDSIFGVDPDPTVFADEGLFEEFTIAARQLPPPQINSMWVWIWEDRDEATQGFRLMGQRFTLDAYVFGQVMWRKVGTMDNPRDLPKGLDFFAAIGSDEALNILDEMGETAYLNYNEQMDKVRQEVAALEFDSWTQNLYWAWLYAFEPIIEPKDERFPAFMQTQAWQRHDLNTALGSWTELKHDTILYAKQVMAEMGGGMAEIERGYVEPNPEAFARLLSLAYMTFSGLESRGLLDANTHANLENLIDLLLFLKDVAERELAGEPLSEDDYWRIALFGGEIEALTLAAADAQDEFDRSLEDQQAALVADVATGIDRVLEEAIGRPTKIYVVLPDEPWRVAVGAVFSYYEFTVPPADRLTDEAWQEMLANGENPPPPDWTSIFMAP